MAESEEELKSLLMKVKEESEKFNIQKTNMASGPITSWQTDGETVETVSEFILGGSKITGEGHGNPLQCSCLKNLMDRGTWKATVHGVRKSQAQLSD